MKKRYPTKWADYLEHGAISITPQIPDQAREGLGKILQQYLEHIFLPKDFYIRTYGFSAVNWGVFFRRSNYRGLMTAQACLVLRQCRYKQSLY